MSCVETFWFLLAKVASAKNSYLNSNENIEMETSDKLILIKSLSFGACRVANQSTIIQHVVHADNKEMNKLLALC